MNWNLKLRPEPKDIKIFIILDEDMAGHKRGDKLELRYTTKEYKKNTIKMHLLKFWYFINGLLGESDDPKAGNKDRYL